VMVYSRQAMDQSESDAALMAALLPVWAVAEWKE
jgi:hypothetical protein